MDKYENMGAQLIKEAAQKTNDKAGDGTTTATILTEAIVKESLKAINAGANPMMLRKGIEKAVDKIVEWLDKTSSKVKNGDEIKNIATISAQDEEIGGIISDAIKKLGRDAVIAVEEGKSSHMSVEYKEGFSFDKGFVAPHFITDEKTQECVIERPYILITDRKINSPLEFNPFIVMSPFICMPPLSGSPSKNCTIKLSVTFSSPILYIVALIVISSFSIGF